ncbi:MAG: glycosyltransferase family 2 protein [Gammaproteobacteria bacterium]|nr:glycosyltransferase family 2 protein [Gammaproteobacteria bacterium]
MTSIVALATCHNRREKTVAAVNAMSAWLEGLKVDARVVIVDDGSTDGTGEAIRSGFPAVEVIEGNGSLFWAGGMRHGWDRAVSAVPPDFLIVFNDDVELDIDGMMAAWVEAVALSASSSVPFLLTGACRDRRRGSVAYGGVRRVSRWHPLRFSPVEPNGRVQSCDTCNMNFTIIPRDALDLIGFLDPGFVHARADFDYGLRLRRAGGEVRLAPHYVGACSRNEVTGSSADPKLPAGERWARLLSIREENPAQRARYYRRHGGVLWPLFWALPYCTFWLRGAQARIS